MLFLLMEFQSPHLLTVNLLKLHMPLTLKFHLQPHERLLFHNLFVESSLIYVELTDDLTH